MSNENILPLMLLILPPYFSLLNGFQCSFFSCFDLCVDIYMFIMNGNGYGVFQTLTFICYFIRVIKKNYD